MLPAMAMWRGVTIFLTLPFFIGMDFMFAFGTALTADLRVSVFTAIDV
jgi:hypothetical protein